MVELWYWEYYSSMNMQLLLMMWAGHYLSDYALQPAYMAEQKAYALKTSEGTHALTAHASIHGLAAGVITGSFAAGLAVGVSHWVIDFGKASVLIKRNKRQGLYGINIDQLLHFVVILTVWLIIT
jgi:hypothetical protein